MKLFLVFFLMSFLGTSYAQTNIPYGSHGADIVNEMLKMKRAQHYGYFQEYITKVEDANLDQNLKCKAIKESFFNASVLRSKCFNVVTNKKVVTLKAELVLNEMSNRVSTYISLFTHKLKKGNTVHFPEI